MWQVVGQDRAVSLLQRSLEGDKLAHAYLFVGPPHVGKMTLALDLARALNCEAAEPPCGGCASCRKIASAKHADVLVVGLADSGGARARAEIGIDQIKDVLHAASLPPFEGSYKVFIVDGAEFLSAEAANCLLKTLEEPAGRAVFVLLTANERLVLDTVLSRCQRVELSPMPAGDVEAALIERGGIEPEKARLLARLSHGCLGWALTAAADDSRLGQRAERMDRLLGVTGGDYDERFAYAAQLAVQFGQDRGLVQEVLDLWLNWWHDALLVKVGRGETVTNVDLKNRLAEEAGAFSLKQIKAVINHIQAAGEQLRLNANPRLVLETLMLSVPRRSHG